MECIYAINWYRVNARAILVLVINLYPVFIIIFRIGLYFCDTSCVMPTQPPDSKLNLRENTSQLWPCVHMSDIWSSIAWSYTSILVLTTFSRFTDCTSHNPFLFNIFISQRCGLCGQKMNTKHRFSRLELGTFFLEFLELMFTRRPLKGD